VKNLGEKAIPMYENLIAWYADAGYEFMRMRDYRDQLTGIS
jgi:hypothetical protein